MSDNASEEAEDEQSNDEEEEEDNNPDDAKSKSDEEDQSESEASTPPSPKPKKKKSMPIKLLAKTREPKTLSAVQSEDKPTRATRSKTSKATVATEKKSATASTKAEAQNRRGRHNLRTTTDTPSTHNLPHQHEVSVLCNTWDITEGHGRHSPKVLYTGSPPSV